MYNSNSMTDEVSFRVAERIKYDGTRFFVPQIREEGDWNDIDFSDDEYSSVSEGYGDLKCESMEDAIRAIKGYCKEKEAELKNMIKETIYHDVKL